MEKIYTDKSVYDASQERIAYLFDHFDNVVVAFSGGKDSGRMAGRRADPGAGNY